MLLSVWWRFTTFNTRFWSCYDFFVIYLGLWSSEICGQSKIGLKLQNSDNPWTAAEPVEDDGATGGRGQWRVPAPSSLRAHPRLQRVLQPLIPGGDRQETSAGVCPTGEEVSSTTGSPNPSWVSGGVEAPVGEPKLLRWEEPDDTERFWTTFERLAVEYKWPWWVWAVCPPWTKARTLDTAQIMISWQKHAVSRPCCGTGSWILRQ